MQVSAKRQSLHTACSAFEMSSAQLDQSVTLRVLSPHCAQAVLHTVRAYYIKPTHRKQNHRCVEFATTLDDLLVLMSES